MTFFYDLNKKLDAIREKPETTHKQLNERDMSRAAKGYEKYGKQGMEALAKAGREGKALDPVRAKYNKYDESVEEGSTGDYSAKKARAGKDIGKPGKNFEKIAKSAGKRYGSKEAGERVAGAVLNKLRGKNEGVEEGLGSVAQKIGKGMKKVGGAVLDKLGHGSDEDLLRDLQKKVGVPQTGKKPMATPRTPITKEEYGPLEEKGLVGGQKKLDRNHNGKLDGEDFAMLRKGKSKEMDEGWDDMMKDVERRRTARKIGDITHGAKHDTEEIPGGRRVTRRVDPNTGYSAGADDDAPASSEKRGRGRPKGSTGKIGAKGPSGKSKLMTKEADHDSQELKHAMAVLKKAGYKVTKTEEELDEKAVSKAQQKFMGMVHATQKGEKAPSKEVAKVAKSMKKKDAEDFAATKHKGLPEKKAKKKEEVEETTVSGNVAPGAAAPAKGKGGMSFGKGIYDSMNRELESMIAESMNISMNMSNDEHGGPSKSLTVTATDEDAMYLGKLLKMAGMGGSEGGCGCGQSPCSCNSAEKVDENQPDWPTDEETSDDALQYSGGLNKPKTTVAGDGQTTVPVTAVQVREESEEELDEQEQVMAPESREEELDEELKRIREMAGIREAAKPDYIDLDKDGDKEEPMKKAAADKAAKDKKVEESILSMTNLWKAYKG